MQTNTRTLLMAAIAAALLAPMVHAQNSHAQGQAATLQAPPLPPTLPPAANGTAQDAIGMAKPVRDDSDRTDTPMTPPAAAQGAASAQADSSMVQRDSWGMLDTDHDGRISTTEAALDPDFNGTLSAMDTNNDGFVSQDEYRAHAKADMP